MKKSKWFILALLVLGLDQVTKIWAASTLLPYHANPMFPSFNLTLAFNGGAAFNFLSQTGSWHRWFFVGFSLLMSGVISVWILRLPNTAKLKSLALAFILGGALGNLIDRAFYGYVIDFIDVYYKNNHWPVFNLADTFICIGALLMLIDLVQE